KSMKGDAAMSAPAGVLVKEQMPWELFDWPREQQRSIYRSWAQYFYRARKSTFAQKYFNLCIEDQAQVDPKALFLRSEFQRSVALPLPALRDSSRAAEMTKGEVATISMEMADCLYDLNRFEDHKMLLHDNIRRRVGTSLKPFEKRLHVVDENFKDSTGDSLVNFFMEYSAQMPGFWEHNSELLQNADNRPLWKILKERQECDVQSVIDTKEVMLSPLERERRRRKTKVFYQNYLGRTWTDFLFLKVLRQNPSLLLDNSFSSSKQRSRYVNKSFQRLKTFTKMLHARSPMYNEYFERCPMMSQQREANLYRIQYQTRRNMLSILNTIQLLRKRNDIKRLRKFVEDVMGNYVVIKTSRVMPWKVEFMNEVYNHLALSLCEGYRLPPHRVTPYDKSAMCNLLNIRVAKPLEHSEFLVVQLDLSIVDRLLSLPPRNSILHLEKRLFFARLPIERTYLLHELADRHMQLNHFVQCLSYAQKAIEEAKKCNSLIWQFLSTMLMAKSHSVLHKYERQTEVLNSAYDLATELKSPKLCTFIELCRMLNKDYITLRKMSQLVTSKRLRTKISNRSSFFSSPQESPHQQRLE
ncbi:hypothetical protein KR018_003015, partial [Drosophila ironensis]